LTPLPGRGLVAGRVRSKAVVAIGNAGRHGDRLRTLFLEGANLRAQAFLPGQIFGRNDAIDFVARHAGGSDHLISRAEPRPVVRLSSGNGGWRAARWRDIFLYFAGVSFSRYGSSISRTCSLSGAIFASISATFFSYASASSRGCQREIRLDVPEQRRLHLVIILLRDRIEFVIVAAGRTAPSARRTPRPIVAIMSSRYS